MGISDWGSDVCSSDLGWLGASRVSGADGTRTLDQIPLPDSPPYKAGIDKGDVLVSLDGAALASTDAWNTALAALKPGQDARLVYRNRAGEHTATLKAVADPTLEVVATEAVGGTLTAAQKTFREAWLGKKSPGRTHPSPSR